MVQQPDPKTYVDTDGLTSVLDSYDRCLEYTVNNNVIKVKSGKYPDWRRFQRDLHGSTVNIQGHGYAMTHVHRRKMQNAEMAKDADTPCPVCNEIDYEDKPHICIVTLTPIIEIMAQGMADPEGRI